jgi:hypothetical protein
VHPPESAEEFIRLNDDYTYMHYWGYTPTADVWDGLAAYNVIWSYIDPRGGWFPSQFNVPDWGDTGIKEVIEYGEGTYTWVIWLGY